MIEPDEQCGDRPGEQEARGAAKIEQSPRRGRKLDTWGWGALLAGAVLFVGDGTLGVQTWWEVSLLLVGFVLMLSGLWAVLRGRRHLQPVLEGLRSVQDDERIVLFLRAFSDDVQFARTPASYPARWLVWPPPVTPADLRTEEQQVARGLAPFGRLVAMGKPSDQLPRAGAERSYASDEQWQNEVLAGFDRADLVVLSAGAGGGLEWEVEQAVQRDDPARLVVAVTRDPRNFTDFRAAVGHLFPKGLPEGPQGRVRRASQVRAVVWFERDWTPHLELLTGKFPLFRSVSRTQYALPRALEPVYERAGLRAPRRGSSSRPRPRAVPVAVTLFSASWFGVPALFIAGMTHQSTFADHSEDTFPNTVWDTPIIFGTIGLILLVPFVRWMRRVLRGGPVAVFMMLMSCVPLGVALLIWAVLFWIFSIGPGSDTVVGRVMSGFGGWLLPRAVVIPVAIALLMGQRQVREWVDSRT